MKTRILILFVLVAIQATALGDGYMLFVANRKSVWDGFTTPGVFVPGGGHTIASFIWGPAGTTNSILGLSGTPTNSVAQVSSFAWMGILNDPQFQLGTNATSGALAEVNVTASGLGVGVINYNGTATFPAAGMVGGQTYTIYCFAWDNSWTDPYQAAAAGSVVGWSNPIQYPAGNGPTSTPPGFSVSGMQPFGVSVPEPSTFALIGLSALALILRCRRRSKH